jgi:uncharacterized protein (TIGR03437 family)
VGLTKRTALLAASLFSAFCGSLNAAPKLRLANTVVGPVWVTAGAADATQTVEIYNAGDGALAPVLSSSATWAAATAGSSHACPAATNVTGTCVPIQIALNTAALTAGTYAAVITVGDNSSAALDAPQDIYVTVRVGNDVDLYVAPGGTRLIEMRPSGAVSGTATTQDGTRWLSLDGGGSLNFTGKYSVKLAPPNGMAEGTYKGQLVVTGGAVDARTIQATMRVASQPIAVCSASPAAASDSSAVRMRLAQGAPTAYGSISTSNAGAGTLTVSSATARGGSWITATPYTASVTLLTFNVGTLSPGIYAGSVDIASNAVNGTVTVPVELEVTAKGAPRSSAGGAVDNAIFKAGDALARGDVAALFGEQLSFSAGTQGSTVPLATALGGASVLFNGQPVPVYYTSYGQINFQVPVDAPLGLNTVQAKRDGVVGNPISVQVVERSPRLLRLNVGEYGAVVNMDYSLPMPAGSLPGWQWGTHPARAGDVLTIYAIGLGPTTVQVASGAAAPVSPLPWLVDVPKVVFGVPPFSKGVTPSYAGLSPGSVGLYQVNITVPDGLGAGDQIISLTFADGTSNTVRIAVQ